MQGPGKGKSGALAAGEQSFRTFGGRSLSQVGLILRVYKKGPPGGVQLLP